MQTFIEKYKDLYGEVYQLHKKYAIVEFKSEADWSRLREDMLVISRKYGENKFVNELLITIASELEREYLKTMEVT